VRLTQADLESLGRPRAANDDSARELAAGRALIARTHEQVESFEAMIRAMREETGTFGDDLAAGADAIRRKRDSVRIDEVVEIAGAMVDRVRTAERRLAAATSEATELRQKLQEARDNARRDPLTGLPNRRALEESYATAAASREAMAFAVCDVDRFKAFNDSFGHLVGDRVLKAIAEVLADHCAGHLVARYGGEEFAVLFSDVSLDEAIAMLDRARATVAGKRYRLRETNAPLGEITFSAGVTAAAPAEPLTELFERADRLLYAAKADGRNCLKAG
jgi:diguanylate cyclase